MLADAPGLPRMLLAFGTAGLFTALTYAHPARAAFRPWQPGDPVPVFAKLLPTSAPRVVESEDGQLTAAPAPEVVPEASLTVAASADPLAAPLAAPLAPHPPGVPQPLIDADHRGMDAFYRKLALAEQGKGTARASQWGDSTIAADGITSTVRSRLQARFGNAGPGYLSAGMDPRWSARQDVVVTAHGEFQTFSLLAGGGGGRYGYGGVVTTLPAEAYVTFTGPKLADGSKLVMKHFEAWYQVGPERGDWWARVGGRGIGSGSALAEGTGDRWLVKDDAQGFTSASVGAAASGPVTFYGVVMETGGPGVVWDALGVVGVGTRSFTQHGKTHLTNQVSHRSPDLVAVMLGGNELGLPVLSKGDGSEYIPYYLEAIHRLRAGAPNSSCLVITPLDQGTREGGAAHTKPNLSRAVAAQQKAAAQEGCAFWNAWAAMGGDGAVVRWGAMKPALAWTDLLHLSSAGQDIIGQMLADAIVAGFDEWKAKGGATRPVPTAPGAP